MLKKLQVLAPQFGRAREDIEAMVSRGRAGDFKGVMQNARLVLEALLRSMVTQELKQQPGKAMLDELITKFRQQANAGVVPTNVLAHMGTVQAWGNLSSHDHAGSLGDQGVQVGADEVVASVNSMVAILTWYAQKYPQAAPTVPPRGSVPSSTPSPTAPGSSKGPLVAGVGAVVVLGAVGAAFALGAFSPKAAAVDPAPRGELPQAAARAALDAHFASDGDPSPPPACRATAEAAALSVAFGDRDALEKLPAPVSPEAAYVLASARVAAHAPAGEAIAKASACPGFAAAFNLQGKALVADGKLEEAAAQFTQALEAAPGYTKARFNLAVVLLKTQKITPGIAELRKIVQSEPRHAEAHFLLGVALEGQGQGELAKPAFCEAWKLGKAEAKSRCPEGT